MISNTKVKNKFFIFTKLLLIGWFSYLVLQSLFFIRFVVSYLAFDIEDKGIIIGDWTPFLYLLIILIFQIFTLYGIYKNKKVGYLLGITMVLGFLVMFCLSLLFNVERSWVNSPSALNYLRLFLFEIIKLILLIIGYFNLTNKRILN